MKKFYVDSEFLDTPYGKRPKWIHFFDTREEADAFAATTADGVVGEMTFVIN